MIQSLYRFSALFKIPAHVILRCTTVATFYGQPYECRVRNIWTVIRLPYVYCWCLRYYIVCYSGLFGCLFYSLPSSILVKENMDCNYNHYGSNYSYIVCPRVGYFFNTHIAVRGIIKFCIFSLRITGIYNRNGIYKSPCFFPYYNSVFSLVFQYWTYAISPTTHRHSVRLPHFPRRPPHVRHTPTRRLIPIKIVRYFWGRLF